MTEHLQFDEDFELYALGALDADERSAFEAHLPACATCKQQLAAAQQRMGLLGMALQQTAPPSRVKDALLQRVRDEANTDARVAPVRQLASVPPSPRPSFWSFLHQPVLAWGCAAVIAVVAIVYANKSQQLHQQLSALRTEMQTQQAAVAQDHRVADLLTSPQTQRVALKQPTDATKPEGRVYYQQKQGLLFYAANLPAASADHVYQLWLVPTEGAPISAGVFQTNAQGEASVVLPTLPAGVSAKAFAVTLEPAGGVPQPTGPKVLLGLV